MDENNIILNISNGSLFISELQDKELFKQSFKIILSEESSKNLRSKAYHIGDFLEKNISEIGSLKAYDLKISGASSVCGKPLDKSHRGYNAILKKRDKGKGYFRKRKKNKKYMLVYPNVINVKTKTLDIIIERSKTG